MDSIIVVEDEPLILEMLVDILEMLGYRARPFPNADLAWNFIKYCGCSPRLLITDLQMPGNMDGVSLVQKVRQLDSQVPIVVATGFHDAADSLQHLQVHWLPKPFDIDQLQRTCGALIHTR